MTTRTKQSLTLLALFVMIFLSVFSRPLGISESVKWILLLGQLVPLGLIFYFNSKLGEERRRAIAEGVPTLPEPVVRMKMRRQLIFIWGVGVICSLTAPLWLPATGTSRGILGDSLVGIATAALISVIFWLRLRRLPAEPAESESEADSAEQDERQP
jgi:hypothetical protein